MDYFRFMYPLSELDQAALHLGESRAQVEAEEERVALAKRGGEDTGALEKRLGRLKESLRLHQEHYDTLLSEPRR
jgi:hypothetical protein